MLKRTNAVHLRPTDPEANAWFGDPVPFYWDGTWHLFYVWDQGHLVLPRVSHAWGHFASKDLVNWEECPMVVAPEPEASCGTGAVFRDREGLFHAYYLGRYFSPSGIMSETLCHATSTDLMTWTKDPQNPISRPDLSRYTVKDWRDGFPFWNEEHGEYWMLVTASLKEGPEPRRGCIALMASKDLKEWEVRDPYWAPYIGRHLECPDLFEWNGWWYLLVSGGYGHTGGTIYRRSRSMYGPWESAPLETFDGPEFYAAKTASDGQRRLIFGWIGTRKGDVDNGWFQWGGHAVIHELVQEEDGSLWAKCPEERKQMGQPFALAPFEGQIGEWRHGPAEKSPVYIGRADDFGYATTRAPQNALIRLKIGADTNARRCGLLLHTDSKLQAGYQVTFDLAGGQFVISAFAPEGKSRAMPTRRPLITSPDGTVDVTVLFADDVLEVYVNDRTVLTNRLYDHQGGEMGLFVEEGTAFFRDIQVRELPAKAF